LVKQKRQTRRVMRTPGAIDGQVEVVSMIGDIALYLGKPVVHAHMVVAASDGTAHGGHVLAA
jgi:hypothetical protein